MLVKPARALTLNPTSISATWTKRVALDQRNISKPGTSLTWKSRLLA